MQYLWILKIVKHLTPDHHRLLLNLSDEISLKSTDKYVALLNLSIYYAPKIWKTHAKTSFNHLMDHSTSDIQDYFKYIIKTHETMTDNPPIRVYRNKMENVITFNIKTRYYLEIETTGTIKLLGSTKNEITKDKNGENIPNLEITDVVLIHGSVVNNDYQHDWISLYAFVQNKIFGQLLDI